MKRIALSVLLVLLSPAMLLAHPGHAGGHGIAGGFAHPFSGLDHLLALLAVGLWSQQLAGRARLGIPLGFVAMMILGGLLTPVQFASPVIEAGVLASVLSLGLILAFAMKMRISVAAAIAGGFALFHGYAHFAEMPAAAAVLPYAAGFVAANVVLLTIGSGLGRLMLISHPTWTRLCGAGIAAVGLCLLVW